MRGTFQGGRTTGIVSCQNLTLIPDFSWKYHITNTETDWDIPVTDKIVSDL